MSEIDTYKANGAGTFDRIERMNTLQPGTYWVCKSDHFTPGIDPNEVVLLRSIDYVDDAPHTLTFLLHPDKQARHERHQQCLIADLYEHFEYEPNGGIIRQKEIEAQKRRIEQCHQDLMLSMTSKLAQSVTVAQALPEKIDFESTSLSNEIEQGIKQAEDRKKQLVQAEENIAHISDELAVETARLAPYYTEMANVALAQTSTAIKEAESIKNGVESLTLYTGKDVHVETVVAGNGAARHEPLVLVQEKHYAQIEVLPWVNHFVSANDGWMTLKERLQNEPGLRDQLFPAKRCVILMANCQDRPDRYTDDPAYLLIRNGENIHRVDSPIGSHLMAGRLFPDEKEVDRIYQMIGLGELTYRDIGYTKALNEHDRLSLHYKRFLILLCGLDHRLRLLGDFDAPKTPARFVSMEFQKQYCVFLNEDREERLADKDWADKCLSELERSTNDIVHGTRVAIHPRNAADYFEKPALYDYSATTAQVVQIEANSTQECLSVRIRKEFQPRRERLSLYDASRTFMWNLDRLSSDQVKKMKNSKECRYRLKNEGFVLLRAALEYTEEREEKEFNAAIDKLMNKGVNRSIANAALKLKRTAKRYDKSAKPDVARTCETLAKLEAQGIEAVIAIAKREGAEVLRIGVDSKGRCVADIEATHEGEITELPDHVWHKRLIFESLPGEGALTVSTSVEWLNERAARADIYEVWEREVSWYRIKHTSHSFFSRRSAECAIQSVDDYAIAAIEVLADNNAIIKLVEQFGVRALQDKSPYVFTGRIGIPLGIHPNYGGGLQNGGDRYSRIVLTVRADMLIYKRLLSFKPETARAFRQSVTERYADQRVAISLFDKAERDLYSFFDINTVDHYSLTKGQLWLDNTNYIGGLRASNITPGSDLMESCDTIANENACAIFASRTHIQDIENLLRSI